MAAIRKRFVSALMNIIPSYAELHCLSNFSFQRGASSARELFLRAKKLAYKALAITDVIPRVERPPYWRPLREMAEDRMSDGVAQRSERAPWMAPAKRRSEHAA